MDILTGLTCVMDYIEQHITDDLDMETIAGVSSYSPFHLGQMFNYIVNIPLSEYIRRRKMTLAAFELQNTDIRVLDIAVKYNYDSADSFSRAFSKIHGITPSAARSKGAKLKAYPKLTFSIIVKGEQHMNYRIEEQPAFDIFGIETISSLENTDLDNEQFLSPHSLWDKSLANGDYKRLEENAGEIPTFLNSDLCKVHGFCSYRECEKGAFAYMLGSFVGKNSKTDGYTIAHIPAYTWVIFPSGKFTWDKVGDCIEGIHERYWNEWLPTSGYEQVDGPDLEIYGGDDKLGYVEIWYPVKKK